MAFDKYFFVVYEKQYSMMDHHFDDVIARQNWQNRVYSRRKAKAKFIEVIRKEEEFSFYELHLNGSRHLFCYVNIIKYIQQKKGVFVDSADVINKSNFMPISDQTGFAEYIEAKREIEDHFKNLYEKILLEYWDYEATEILVKPVQLEVAYEVYPASVNDISNLFHVKGLSFRKYNSQSGTIYLNSFENSTDCVLPAGEGVVSLSDIFDFAGHEDDYTDYRQVEYVNGVNSGISTDKVQIKFYQKTFGLVRIEFSILSSSIKKLSSVADYRSYVFHIMRDHITYFESIKRFDISLESIVKAVAVSVGITEEICYAIKDIGVWESSRDTISVMRKLRRKGLLIPVFDDVGTRKRGIYYVAPWFQEIFKRFQPSGKELFLPGLIKKR